ncbi:hypothetical protein FA246_10035 [Pseudomonas aeruginosa]|nr:hypothetical protein [Pseudomonas aeruginosa]
MSVEIHLPGPASALPARLDGVVIGILLDVPDAATTQLGRADIGAQVALMFVAGDPRQPLLIGRIQRLPQEASAQLDGERLEFSAEREIVLRCGKASITLTRAGKVIIRGAYLSSRSTGVNRIKGGSVQIN